LPGVGMFEGLRRALSGVAFPAWSAGTPSAVPRRTAARISDAIRVKSNRPFDNRPFGSRSRCRPALRHRPQSSPAYRGGPTSLLQTAFRPRDQLFYAGANCNGAGLSAAFGGCGAVAVAVHPSKMYEVAFKCKRWRPAVTSNKKWFPTGTPVDDLAFLRIQFWNLKSENKNRYANNAKRRYGDNPVLDSTCPSAR